MFFSEVPLCKKISFLNICLRKSEDLADVTPDDEPVKLGPDNLLNMEVGINLEEHGFRQGKVKKRAVGVDGTRQLARGRPPAALDGKSCRKRLKRSSLEVLLQKSTSGYGSASDI